jgi:hypothetical protein
MGPMTISQEIEQSVQISRFDRARHSPRREARCLNIACNAHTGTCEHSTKPAQTCFDIDIEQMEVGDRSWPRLGAQGKLERSSQRSNPE